MVASAQGIGTIGKVAQVCLQRSDGSIAITNLDEQKPLAQ